MKSYGIDGDLSKLLINYREHRKQRTVLNGQASSWKSILAGVPQGSGLGLVLFLISINNLRDGTKLVYKIFTDDVSLFSKLKDKSCSAVELNTHLGAISNWAVQWKVLFNPGTNKRAVEIFFLKGAGGGGGAIIHY